MNPEVGVATSVGEAQIACGLDSLPVFESFDFLDFRYLRHLCHEQALLTEGFGAQPRRSQGPG